MKTTAKLRVALFFGGVSSEHEVSCVSASAWLRALGQSPCAEQYEAFPVGITKDGRWLACSPTPEAMADGSWEQGSCTPCVLSPDRADHGIWLLKDGKAELVRIDICAPVMHGKNGEDGTIQGLFELARIPYVGCGVLGSAVCMDKAVANALMDAAGVPHCKWVAASRADLELNGPVVLDGIEAKLGYPIFVKPPYYKDRRPNETKYYMHQGSIPVYEYNNSGRMVEKCYGDTDIPRLAGAGAWCGSAAELSRLIASIDGMPHVKDILSKKSVDFMTREQPDHQYSIGWNYTPKKGRPWIRTGSLAGTSALILKYDDGQCWILITNTSTWKGHGFSNDSMAFFEKMRKKYMDSMPKQDLFLHVK